ncbi:hypothetical protein KDX27_30290 [Burkholderia cenocepacia]|uniref:Cro/CI family transcriptional regulator n=1 Tax=Burkholderia cenocepacia TaxID=95486 RepID=UPI001B8E4867|nr:Cro/CI family transcriptional regulator [Burkholderia cenocepacia]MBR8028895.1 hypothetical protein [Burkholderia cenocepacia]MBR8172023.1 hypothetical protein [Burkholderia cenocepacia]
MDIRPGDAYASQIIDRLGGTGAVADLFEIDSAAVSQWRKKGIPKPRLQFLRLAHPEAFEGLSDSPQPVTPEVG